ncbi:hypothetical protein [Kitasatospora sp. NPDC058478]|uniref:hypothetical protein n=1 Tax=unclassified Kitasatospora TaxID=2633591 RepID=UPI00364C87FB
MDVQTYDPTCRAHYADDPHSCSGPAVVTVIHADRVHGSVGCERHAADRMAAWPGSYPIGLPDAPVGTAVRVFKAAHGQG